VVAVGRTGLAGLLRPLRREDWRVVDEWLDRLGLAHLATAAYGDLSGGEQRKGLIAKAMVQKPELLLLDEPTANLDLFWREQIVATLQRLYEQARPSLVLVCHELEVIPPCVSRIALLEDGRLVAAGASLDVLTTERVGPLYGPGLDVVSRGGRWAVVPREAGDA
jgi:iron complex transport system ATP-binding protein